MEMDGWVIDSRVCRALGDKGMVSLPRSDVPILVDKRWGKTRVRADLIGTPKSQALFWDAAHEVGVSNDTTLADHLDRRESPVGDPTAADLPSHVNFMDVLYDTLGSNLLIVESRVGSFGSRRSHAFVGDLLRRLLPARFLCTLLFYPSASEEEADFDEAEEEIRADYWAGDLDDSYNGTEEAGITAWIDTECG